MKELNIKKNFIILLTSFFLIISCSNEETVFELDENAKNKVDLTTTQISNATHIAKAITDASIDFNDPKLITGVDQKMIDNTISKYNLDKITTGVVRDPKVINQIIADIGKAYEMGPENYINSLPYSSFSKRILLNHVKGQSVDNLEKQIGFTKISKEEQELLLFNNELIKEIVKIGNNDSKGFLLHCNNHNNPDGCQTGHSIGSAVGSIAGNIVCGSICGGIGGFIGGIIGGHIGGGGKQ